MEKTVGKGDNQPANGAQMATPLSDKQSAAIPTGSTGVTIAVSGPTPLSQAAASDSQNTQRLHKRSNTTEKRNLVKTL